MFLSYQDVVTGHSGSSEKQPGRNEEHEGYFFSSFVFFVSSWLLLDQARSG